MAQRRGVDAGERGLDLIGHILHGQVGFALLKALAHADDGVDTVGQQGLGLGVDEHIVLAVVLTALAVADDAVLGADVGQLGRGDFAGVGALFKAGTILAAGGNLGVLAGLDHGRNHDAGHAEDDVAGALGGHISLQFFNEGLDLGGKHVHLPVAGDDSLAVFSVHLLISTFRNV